MYRHHKRIIAALLSVSLIIPMTVSHAQPLSVSAYELLGETTFDHKLIPWTPVDISPAKQTFDFMEGAAHLTILVPQGIDRSNWDLQFRHRGLSFKSGHEYKVSFKAKGSRVGIELCSYIGTYSDSRRFFVLNGQESEMIMGPDMDGRWGTPANLTMEYQEFSGIFIPTEDISLAEWTFQYGYDVNGYGGNVQSGDELWFDDMSIEDLSDPDYVPPQLSFGYTSRSFSGLENNYISVNQLGYDPAYAKIATLGDNQGDLYYDAQAITLSGAYDYELVDAVSGNVVFAGQTDEPVQDADSGDTVCKIDFSDFQTPGTYYLRIRDKEWRSFPFEIRNGLYGDSGLLSNALNFFYQNRGGCDIDSAYITSGDKTQLAHADVPGHAAGLVQSAWNSSILISAAYAEQNASSQIAVSGGWYSGEQYAKFMTEGGMSVWTLQNLYERAMQSESGKAQFADGSGAVTVPETDNGVPDILDECRYELDFMEQMKVQSDEPTWGEFAGLYYHGVQGVGFRSDLPDYAQEHDPVFAVLPPTFAATLNYAACAAQAARLWAPYDADYAAELLQRAKEAYQAFRYQYYEAAQDEERNEKSLYAPVNTYEDGDTEVLDDACWAACELYITAKALGDADADSYMQMLSDYQYAFQVSPRIVGSENGYMTGDSSYTVFNHANTGSVGALSLLLHTDLLSAQQTNKLKSSLLKTADDYVNTAQGQGYGIPYKYDGDGYDDEQSSLWIYSGYENSSNERVLNNMIAMAYAYDLTGDAAYMNGVISGMDYLLGRNPMAYSFITGYGSYAVKNPVHRYWQGLLDPQLPYAPDGVLVSGPSAVYLDRYMHALGFEAAKPDAPSQRFYADSVEAYAVNRSSLSGNASLAWMTAFLTDGSEPDESDADGDVNADGVRNLEDAVLLQKWLLCEPDTALKNWKAADLNADRRLDARDLSLLKREILL